jgi:hypothetical protein
MRGSSRFRADEGESLRATSAQPEPAISVSRWRPARVPALASWAAPMARWRCSAAPFRKQRRVIERHQRVGIAIPRRRWPATSAQPERAAISVSRWRGRTDASMALLGGYQPFRSSAGGERPVQAFARTLLCVTHVGHRVAPRRRWPACRGHRMAWPRGPHRWLDGAARRLSTVPQQHRRRATRSGLRSNTTVRDPRESSSGTKPTMACVPRARSRNPAMAWPRGPHRWLNGAINRSAAARRRATRSGLRSNTTVRDPGGSSSCTNARVIAIPRRRWRACHERAAGGRITASGPAPSFA